MTLPRDALTLIIADSLMLVLATIAVGIRFAIRRSQKLSPRADDWTILAALVLSIAICIAGIHSAATGLVGVSLFDMPPAVYEQMRKIMIGETLVGQNIYGLTKISVVLFYRRLFTSMRFKLVTNIVIVATVLYMVFAFFLVLFCARDISSFWTTPVEREGTEYVLDFGTIIVAVAAVDIALDMVILVLPLPVINRLKIDRKQKLQVIGVFFLGAFCLVSSIIRLRYTIPLVSSSTPATQRTEVGDNNILWSHVEACASVFTACLPTFAPLYRSVASLNLARITSFFSFRSRNQDSIPSFLSAPEYTQRPRVKAFEHWVHTSVAEV